MSFGDFDDEFEELAGIVHDMTEYDPFDAKTLHCVFCHERKNHNHQPDCLFKRAENWRWRHATTPRGLLPR